MRALAILAALWVTHPAQAQDLIYSNEATLSCISSNSDRVSRMRCIGLSADACMQNSPGGETTVGMGGCLHREFQAWDKLLNKTYGQYLQRAQAIDAENAKYSDNLPKLAVSLREMQQAWIPFRDATCDYERAQWGNGTGGGPATARCRMRVTAEQTLALDEMWLGE